jgi:Domain of unknown function (DUF5025)
MKTLIISAFALLLITGCHKYDDTAAAKLLQVPPYTETGANTFGCLLNGAVWANFGKSYGNSGLPFGTRLDSSKVTSTIEYFPTDVFHTGSDTTFQVSAQYQLVKKGNELRDETMSITLPKNGSLVGTYMLTGINGSFQYTQLDENYNATNYTSQARNPFMVTVNKDSLVNGYYHIVSGRFSGVLYNAAHTDSVRISGGVFDTKTGN